MANKKQILGKLDHFLGVSVPSGFMFIMYCGDILIGWLLYAASALFVIVLMINFYVFYEWWAVRTLPIALLVGLYYVYWKKRDLGAYEWRRKREGTYNGRI